MKNIIVALGVVLFLLASCAIVPTGYGRYGVVVNGPAYSGYSHYGGHGFGGYSRYPYGYGWGTRWVPGYQRWVCEGLPPLQKCFWTWTPAHYE